MEVMRGNLGRLEVLARETLDLATSHRLLDTVERHREQLTACQRQFRLANVKVQSVVSPTAGPPGPRDHGIHLFSDTHQPFGTFLQSQHLTSSISMERRNIYVASIII